jgi:hypothetical protein
MNDARDNITSFQGCHVSLQFCSVLQFVILQNVILVSVVLVNVMAPIYRHLQIIRMKRKHFGVLGVLYPSNAYAGNAN